MFVILIKLKAASHAVLAFRYENKITYLWKLLKGSQSDGVTCCDKHPQIRLCKQVPSTDVLQFEGIRTNKIRLRIKRLLQR